MATVGSLAQMSGPATCAALFAFSIGGHHPVLVDHNFIFYVLALVRFVVGCVSWKTIGVDHAGKITPNPKRDAPVKINNTIAKNGAIA